MFVDINYIDMWNWCLRWSTSTWNSIYFFLVGYLYCFITLISLKLSELGIVLLVSNGIFLTYTSFYLFLGIDLLVKIGLK